MTRTLLVSMTDANADLPTRRDREPAPEAADRDRRARPFGLARSIGNTPAFDGDIGPQAVRR